MVREVSISDRIACASSEMMLKYGIRSVSMDDIAQKLGISKKTIYQYYADKDSLVAAVFQQLIGTNCEFCLRDQSKAENAIQEALLNIETISAMFQSINHNVMNDLSKYHPGVFEKIGHHKDEFVFELIKNNIIRGQKEELYRKDLEVEILSRYRVETLFIFFSESFSSHIKADFAAIEKEIITHFIYGLVTPLGYDMIEKYKNNIQHPSQK